MSISLVQHKGNYPTANGTSVSATFDSGPTEGNLLLAWVRSGNASSVSGFTTILSGTWGVTLNRYHLCAKMAGSGESSTVTATQSPSSFNLISIAEFSASAGWDIDTVTDTTNQTSVTSSNPSLPSITPVGSVERLLIAAIGWWDVPTFAITWPAGWTQYQKGGWAGAYQSQAVAYQVVASTSGSYDGALTAGSALWGLSTAALAPGAGGGSTARSFSVIVG